ncbi:MAG: 4-hydroxy-3-methylbut-2-enyl diphosphate reductase [Candidatus Omnitrophica bacterium]|nr:4-hydroxy-3-methylbut-2-enyl diphosphate reductase [Candidatus Omnitrophota bacterium]
MESPIVRRGFGLKELVKGDLEADYRSRLVEAVRQRSHIMKAGDLTIRLAKEFGFCYGVERAVDYAYETRKQFPHRGIFLTNELIHNPRVNNKLRNMGIRFLHGGGQGDKQVQELVPEDVVIIAAFGTPVVEMDLLRQKGCVLVDATCGSVIQVWKRVEQYAREGFTAVVHGNSRHEETRATVSRATQYPEGRYVVVWDKAEAELVCRAVREGCDPAEFMRHFAQKTSPRFDPARDLVRVGVANQTTMLSSESLEIAEMLKVAMARRYGEAQLDDHFRSFDTICSATQDRQDAILELVKSGLDLVIIIGGFNSSNTNHLCEIASQFTAAYHIDDAESILSATSIRHKPAGKVDPVISEGWLPDRPLTIGVTAGASTPNRVIGDAIERLLRCRSLTLDQVQLNAS